MIGHKDCWYFHEKFALRVSGWLRAETFAHTWLTSGTKLTCCQCATWSCTDHLVGEPELGSGFRENAFRT
jgi:hypothetical protein